MPRPIVVVAFAVILLQSGCGAIQSLNAASQPLDIYELTTPALDIGGRRRNLELVVEEPIASGSVATERIMIRPRELQAEYLPGARWPDPAPEMLQTLILRTLLQTEALGSVGRRPVGTVGDYALLSELTDFQAETDGETTQVHLRLIARLVRERDAQVIASRGFSVIEPAASTRTDDVVSAFDRAAGRLLGEMAPWVLARLGA